MPRSSRRRRDYAGVDPEALADQLAGFATGVRRTELRGGREWLVQPIRTGSSEKKYRCPGCGGEIPVGTEHVVAWRTDDVRGDQAGMADRRHWHRHCWRTS